MFFEQDETAIRFKNQCENAVHQTKIHFMQSKLEFSDIVNLAVEIISRWFVCSIFLHYANQSDV